MDKLITSLEPALQKLSETFCVSVDFIRENAMKYILEYGEYCAYSEIIGDIALWFFIGLIVLICTEIIVF